MQAKTASVTTLLKAAAAGDSDSADKLLEVIYHQLREMAQDRLRQAPAGTRLQPTELVHEAYVRLFGRQAPRWNSRGHFFAAAGQAMRNILVEQARHNGRLKRGGRRKRVALGERVLAIDAPADDVLAVDELLAQLERVNPRKAKLVLLHCFSGLTFQETAAAMDLSLSTVQREWRFTCALLKSKLDDRKNKSV